MENIFEQASRKKLRYQTTRGMITTEDLWDLSLEDLDKVAKAINKQVKDSAEESFIKKRTVADKKAVLQLEVVKSVINTKLLEAEVREKKAEIKVKRDKMLELIAQKEESAMQKKSLTSLQAELDKLEAEAESLELAEA